MPTWGQLLREINGSAAPNGNRDHDGLRRKYLQQVHDLTGRAVILYSTAWLETRPINPSELQVALSDVQGVMEAVSNVAERELDLIIHSPGGSAEAAESLVEYLRERFDHIRAFIPVAAMSAATMIALGADELVMGQHSQIGPIDPQFIINTPEGQRSAPAKAILNQFERAKQECQDSKNLAAWMPIIRSYAPGLLNQCQNSQALASNLVAGWLERYMFAGELDPGGQARSVAEWLGDYDSFQSHGRRVGREQARDHGVRITDLETDQDLQDAVLSVHHGTMLTFGGTQAVKIIENHHGRAWIRTSAVQVTTPAQPSQIPIPAPLPVQDPPPPQNRAERRRQDKGRPR